MLEVNKFMMEGEQIDFQDAEAREEINEQVARLDGRVDDVDERVTSEVTRLDGRIDTVNGRVTSEIARLEGEIDTEATRLDGRVDTVNNRVTSEATRLDGKIDTQGVPIGGTDGQVLTKDGASNYATKWATPSSVIDDTATSTDKTWSSSKINTILNEITESSVSVTLGNLTTTCLLKKIGKNVKLTLNLENYTVDSQATIPIELGLIPEAYRPKMDSDFTILLRWSGPWKTSTYDVGLITIGNDGRIYLYANATNLSNTHYINQKIIWEV